MRVLALDVGTSSVKAAVLDVAAAQPVGPIARAGYELDFPTPDAAEVPAARLWSTVMSAAHAAARDVPGIEAIGLSVMTPTLVLLDRADRPVGPIWTHLDRRGRPAARAALADVGDELLATAGNRPVPGGMSGTSYRQQVTDDPGLRDRIGSYLHLNGWLALALTGERAFDPGNASVTGLYGTLADQAWSSRWCHYFDVDPAWLPPVTCGTTTIGGLRPAVATELGLPVGLPVKLGTADASCAVLAADMRPGDLLHMVGTTQVLICVTRTPVPTPRRVTRRLGVGGLFLQATHNPVGGAALGWLKELCFREQDDQEFYGQTVPGALQRATSVVLDPPFLGGDRLEIEPRRAGFRELTLGTDRLDLLAAVLTAMRTHHEQALADLGQEEGFDRLFLTGGAADLVVRLFPGYARSTPHVLGEGSLRGVARLFAPAP